MQTEQEIQDFAKAIIQFTDSYTQNKQGKHNEQPESESVPSLTNITSSLQLLSKQIWNNNACKSVTKIPKLLQSLSALTIFKLGTHIDLDVDQQRLEVRYTSRLCLYWIQVYGDKQVQTELVNVEYGRMMSISFCTAGGQGEEQDQEIRNGLVPIYFFLRDLHEGRNAYQPYFQPLPLLARRSEEQIEEEGVNEEIEAQMKNSVLDGHIKNWAKKAKATALNRFIYQD
ncbi:MAG: hypothetical protein EZS28_032200 [Streblomastix strix]|uniref:Uncharacterized protein n=1 Tax=Streblomastix strix TaxID=222440 RepID=A0A5J4UPR4_9EUKA|nr:MAG: hypothetical protein EZS28_032200 [Streblomastix strix]